MKGVRPRLHLLRGKRAKKTEWERKEIGILMGSETGEGDHDVLAGGWAGTDDATSTAPADLPDIATDPTGKTSERNVRALERDFGSFSDLQEIEVPEWRPGEVFVFT